MQSIERTLGQIEGKMEHVQSLLHHITKQNNKLDQRLTLMEHSQHRFKGGSSVIIALSTFFGGGVSGFLCKVFHIL